MTKGGEKGEEERKNREDKPRKKRMGCVKEGETSNIDEQII